MRSRLLPILTVLHLTPAWADPQADADYIVSQALTKDIFEGAIQSQRSLILSAIQHDLIQSGVSLPDPNRFFDIFIEEFIDEFTLSMRQQSAPIYLDAFTAEELSEIAAFYRTEAGQALLRQTPQLMAAGTALGQQAGLQAGQNASGRVIARLEREDINFFDDRGMMDRFIDALR